MKNVHSKTMLFMNVVWIRLNIKILLDGNIELNPGPKEKAFKTEKLDFTQPTKNKSERELSVFPTAAEVKEISKQLSSGTDSSKKSYLQPTESSLQKVKVPLSRERTTSGIQTEICECFSPETFKKKPEFKMNRNTDIDIETVSPEQCSTIAQNITDEEIPILGQILGITSVELDEIMHHTWLTDKHAKVYYLLTLWKRRKGSSATHNTLRQILITLKRLDLVKDLFPGFQETHFDTEIHSETTSTEKLEVNPEDIFFKKLVKLISEDFLAYKCDELSKELKLTYKEIKEINKNYWYTNKDERVSGMLMKWMQRCPPCDRRNDLIQALNKIHCSGKAKKISQLYEEVEISNKDYKKTIDDIKKPSEDETGIFIQKVVTVLIDDLNDRDFDHLSKELKLTEKEINELRKINWFSHKEEKLTEMLKIFIQKSEHSLIKHNLIHALKNIYRSYLAKKIYLIDDITCNSKTDNNLPSEMQKISSVDEKNIITQEMVNYLAGKMKSSEVVCLCRNLGFTENEIDEVTDISKDPKEGIFQLLIHLKLKSKSFSIENDIYQALCSIKRGDLAKDLFPDFITEDLIDKLAVYLKTWQITYVAKNLGLTEAEVDEIRRICLYKNELREAIQQMLLKWKEKYKKSSLETDLSEALRNLSLEYSIENLFTDINKNESNDEKSAYCSVKTEEFQYDDTLQRTMDRIANTINEKDGIKLFRELGLLDREINEVLKMEWINERENKYFYLFKVWKQKYYYKATTFNLCKALEAINCSDLIKELKHDSIEEQSNKSLSSESETGNKIAIQTNAENYHLKLLSAMIGESDGELLFKNLKISPMKLLMMKNCKTIGEYPQKCHRLLQEWKENFDRDDDWKNILNNALVVINRVDITQAIFPELMPKLSTHMKQESESASNNIPKDNTYIGMDIVSEDTLKKLIAKLDEQNILLLCTKLGIPKKEVEEVLYESNIRDFQKKGICLLVKWKVNAADAAKNNDLIDALFSMSREDLVLELFPNVFSDVSIGKDKRKRMINVEKKYLPLKKVSDMISKEQAKALFKELGLTEKEMHEESQKAWLYDEKKMHFSILQNWWLKTEDWECKLPEALAAINCENLAKELFPNFQLARNISTRKKINETAKSATSKTKNSIEEFGIFDHQLKNLSTKLKDGEALPLCKSLGLKDEEIEKVLRAKSGKVYSEQTFNLLKEWKRTADTLATENVLISALYSINRPDLIKVVFPTAAVALKTTGKQTANIISREEKSLKTFCEVTKDMNKNETKKLFQELGLTDNEIKEAKGYNLFGGSKLNTESLLYKWWQKIDFKNMDSILKQAFASIKRLDLLNQLLPVSDFLLFERLFEKIDEHEALFLFQELGLTDQEVEDEKKEHPTENLQTKFCYVLVKWKDSNPAKYWKNNLVDALASLNRQDLIEELFPISVHKEFVENKERSVSPVYPSKEFHVFKHLVEKISEDEALFLFQELGLTDEEVNEEMAMHQTENVQMKFCYILQKWKNSNECCDNYENLENILIHALASINRKDLIKELFPTCVMEPHIDETEERPSSPMIISNDDILIESKQTNDHKDLESRGKKEIHIKDNKIEDFQTHNRLISEANETESNLSKANLSFQEERELFTHIFYKMDEDEGLFLFNNLKELTKDEIGERIERRKNLVKWQEIYCDILRYWKCKVGFSWEDDLVEGLVSIDRKDIVKDFFPKYCQTSDQSKKESPPSFSYEERTQLLHLFKKIGKDDSLSLLIKLNALSDCKINLTSDYNWQENYYNILEKWKPTFTDWEFELVQALVTINRQDAIKDFFPDFMKYPSESKATSIKNTHFSTEKKHSKFSSYETTKNFVEQKKQITKSKEIREKELMDEFQRRVQLLKKKNEEKASEVKETKLEEAQSLDTDEHTIFQHIQDNLKDSYFHFRQSTSPWLKLKNKSFEELYVPLNLINKTSDDNEEIELKDLFSNQLEIDTNRILVEASPGFGKTMFCYKLAFDWSRGESYLQKFDFVFVILLRNFTGNLEEMMVEECNVRRRSKTKVLALLAQYEDKILLILDGYEELAEEKKKFLIPLLVGEQNSKMTVLVTSRKCVFRPFSDNEVDSELERDSIKNSIHKTEGRNIWQTIEICGISENKTEQLVQNYFETDAKTYSKRISLMLSEDMKIFLKSPLILLLLAIIAEEKDLKKITSLTELMKHVLNVMIKNHGNEKIVFNLFNMDIEEPLPKSFLNFGNFALNMLSHDTYIFNAADTPNLIDSINALLSLGILKKNIELLDDRNVNVLEPINKIFLEFLAAFYVSNFIKYYYIGKERFQNFLNVLLCEFICKRNHSLFLLFLSGLLEENISILFQYLTSFSFMFSAFAFPICEMVSESPCRDKLWPEIQPFIPSQYTYLPTLARTINLTESTKRYLIEYGIKNKKMQNIEINISCLEDMPKIENADTVFLTIDDDKVVKKSYQLSENINITCNDLVICLIKVFNENWKQYAQVIGSIRAQKLHVYIKPNLVFQDLTCICRINEERKNGFWKDLNFTNLNLSINFSIEQKSVLKLLRVSVLKDKIIKDELNLRVVYHSKSIKNLLLHLKMNVDNTITCLKDMEDHRDLEQDQIFLIMEEAAEFLLMCLDSFSSELKRFEFSLGKQVRKFKSKTLKESFPSDLEKFIAEEIRSKITRLREKSFAMFTAVKTDKDSFFSEKYEMVKLFPVLSSYLDVTMSKFSEFIHEIYAKEPEQPELLRILQNKDESVQSIKKELKDFYDVLGNSILNTLSLTNSKQSQPLPLNLDQICGKKKWKRISIENSIKLEFNASRDSKFDIAHLALDGNRENFATNDVRTILQCQHLVSLVCSMNAIDILNKSWENWKGYESLQKLKVNFDETTFLHNGFPALRRFCKIECLKLDFRAVWNHQNYQKDFVKKLPLHSLKRLEFQNTYFVGVSFLKDFMCELLEDFSTSQCSKFQKFPLANFLLTELKIDFPCLQKSTIVQELFLLVDRLLTSDIIEYFTFVTNDNCSRKIFCREVVAMKNWKVTKANCCRKHSFYEHLWDSSKEVPQMFSITKV